MAFEFRFPDVGEGIAEGELLSWKVKEGDQVAQDQTLAEMETDKAVVELPSPRAGRVLKLHAGEGDMVNVGDVLVSIEEGRRGAGCGAEAPAAPSAPRAAAPPHRGAAAREPEPAPYTGSVVGRLEEAPEEEEQRAPEAAGATWTRSSGDPRDALGAGPRSGTGCRPEQSSRDRAGTQDPQAGRGGYGPVIGLWRCAAARWDPRRPSRFRARKRHRRRQPCARRRRGRCRFSVESSRATAMDRWRGCFSGASAGAWPGAWPRPWPSRPR